MEVMDLTIDKTTTRAFRIKQSSPPEMEDVFARQKLISWWDQNKIGSARVLVIGAGALGNEALKNLALTGFRYITICDFDTIEPSNLSRTVLFRPEDVGKAKCKVAAARATELSLLPDSEIRGINCDVVWELGLGEFDDADVVIGCLDNVEARLAVNLACNTVGTPWIDAGTSELAGYVAAFDGSKGSCYECGITPSQFEKKDVRYECGKFMREQITQGAAPSVQVVSAIAAGLQCQTAAKLICGQPVNFGKRLFFQGLVDFFDIHTILRKTNCNAHVRNPPPVHWNAGSEQKLGEFLRKVGDELFNGQSVTLDLSAHDRSFVTIAHCRLCQEPLNIWLPKNRITKKMLHCSESDISNCERRSKMRGNNQDAPTKAPIIIEETSRFSLSDSPKEILKITLREIGIPPRDILHVHSGEISVYIKLAHEKVKMT